MTLDRPTPAGWYQHPDGGVRWWDGRAWTIQAPSTAMQSAAQAPSVHVVHHAQKDVGVAYLLAILLGGFAAHRFYLGRLGSAIALLLLWQIGLLTLFIGIGFVLCAAAAIWWIVDLFRLRGMVRDENRQRMAHATWAQ